MPDIARTFRAGRFLGIPTVALRGALLAAVVIVASIAAWAPGPGSLHAGDASPAFTDPLVQPRSATTTYTVEALAVPANGDGGYVEIIGGTLVRSGVKRFNYGEQATFQAHTNPGWRFVRWSGDLSGTNPRQTMTIYSNKTVTGHWEETRPPPPPPPTRICLTTDLGTVGNAITRSDYWSSTDCESSRRSGSNADRYRFRIDRQSEVTIDLTAAADAYLYLLTTSLTVIERDDDSGGSGNSRIRTTLAAGTYIIEATTWSSGMTGAYQLGVNPGSTTPPSSTYTVQASAVPADGSGGYVEIIGGTLVSPGVKRFNYGEQASIGARTKPGWRFVRWSGDLSGTNPRQTLTMDSDKTVTAHWEEIPSAPPGSCSITDLGTVGSVITQSGEWSAGDCESSQRSGSNADRYRFRVARHGEVTIDLTSADADAYLYLLTTSLTEIEHNDDYAGSRNSRIQTTLPPGAYIIEATTYRGGAIGAYQLRVGPGSATPQPVTHTVTAIGNPGDGGHVDISGGVIVSPGVMRFNRGEQATIQAHTKTGWRFVRWSGDLSGAADRQALTVDGDKTVTAHWQRIAAATYTVTAIGNPGDGGRVEIIGGTVVSPGVMRFNRDEQATIQAHTETGWRFVRWSGDLSGAADRQALTVDDDKTVTAHWERIASAPPGGAASAPPSECITQLGRLTDPVEQTGWLKNGDCIAEYTGKGRWSDGYFFSLGQTTPVTIDLISVSSGLDAFLVLFGPDGQEIARDNDSGAGRNAKIIRSLPAGSYVIAATKVNGGSRSYRLQIHGIQDSTSSTDDPCTPHDLGTISGIVRRSGSLQDGDCVVTSFVYRRWTDVFSFSLPRPMRVQIDLTSSDINPALVLFGPDGDRIERNDDGGAHDSAQIVRDLSAGRYRLHVTKQEVEEGSYQLGVRTSTALRTPQRVPSGCRSGGTVDNGIVFPTRYVKLDAGSSALYRVTGADQGGGRVLYTVCSDNQSISDEIRDRAIFTAGYFYTTAPGFGGFSRILHNDIRSTELGLDAHRSAYKKRALFKIANTALQATKAAVVLYHAPTNTFGEVVKHLKKEVLGKEFPHIIATVGVEAYSMQLEAITEHPDELVAEIALEYVTAARGSGQVWPSFVSDNRSQSQKILIFGEACLASGWEYEISAGGSAGRILEQLIEEAERQQWRKLATNLITTGATIIYPPAGLIVHAVFELANVTTAIVQEIRDLDQGLRQYEPYRDLVEGVDRSYKLVEHRHADILSRLGITNDLFKSCPAAP